MSSPINTQVDPDSSASRCTDCVFWKSKVCHLEHQVDSLARRLSELQTLHNDEVDVLNATVIELRKEMKTNIKRDASSSSSSSVAAAGGVPLLPSPETTPDRGRPAALSSQTDRGGPLCQGKDEDGESLTPAQPTVVRELGPNPNQLGEVVLSAFSPQCEASEGSSAQVDEFEWRRRGKNTERWFETSVLQAAVAKYADTMRERRMEKDAQLSELLLDSTVESQMSSAAIPEEISSPTEVKQEKKKKGIFATLWGDGSSDEEEGKGPRSRTKGRKCKRGARKTKDLDPRDENHLSIFVRLRGNQPEASTEDEMSVPRFSAENLSPALQREFDPTGEICNPPRQHSRTRSGQQSLGDVDSLGSGDTDVPQIRLRRLDEVRVDFMMPTLFGDVASSLGTQFAAISHAALDMDTPWRLTESPGKSDAKIYYFSHFVIKSLTESEVNFSEDFFEDYAGFVKSHTDTFLPHFVGLFTVTRLKTLEKVTFMMSNNVLQTRCYVSSIYDLKGSTIGREGTSKTGPALSSASEQVVIYRTATGAPLLKDNDLPLDRPLLQVGPVVKAQVLARLRADTNWLEKLGIIDYSLLIGLRSRKGSFSNVSLDATVTATPISPARSDYAASGTWASHHNDTTIITSGRYADALQDTGISSLRLEDPGLDGLFQEETYYMGLIDVFQQFSGKKKLEHFAKGLLVNRHKISVVPPDEFAQRLCVLLEKISE